MKDFEKSNTAEEISLGFLLRRLKEDDPTKIFDKGEGTKHDLASFNQRMDDMYLGAKMIQENPDKYGLDPNKAEDSVKLMVASTIVENVERREARAQERMRKNDNFK